MQRPGSLALAVKRPEFDVTLRVAVKTPDAPDDLQTGPLHLRVDVDALRACPGMPGPPQVVGITDREGAVARPHELFGGLRLRRAEVKRQAADTELVTAAARAVS